MFKDLDFRSALKRAALFTGLWLALLYVLSTAFPQSFNLGLGTRAGQIGLLLNALLFFCLYTVVVAFTERRRRRLLAERSGEKPKVRVRAKAADTEEDGDEDAEPGPLKGRHNPNTSRKKASRRRR